MSNQEISLGLVNRMDFPYLKVKFFGENCDSSKGSRFMNIHASTMWILPDRLIGRSRLMVLVHRTQDDWLRIGIEKLRGEFSVIIFVNKYFIVLY